MNRPGRCRGALAAASIAVVVLTSAAAIAASGRVILLQSHGASPGARRCLTLIHDELKAGGFDVTWIDAGPASDPVSIADLMRRQQDAAATIALLGNPEAGTSELWILDGIGGAAEVRRIPAPTDDPERVAEVLAIRTIELLRASALKWLVESTRRQAPPPPVVISAPANPSAPARETVAIETGLSVLYSVAGVGPAALPVGRLRVPVAAAVFLRLSVAGLGTRPRVESQLGSAEVAQELSVLELGGTLRRGQRVRPAITAGAGVFHARIEGQGIPPYLGARDASWAAMFDCGVGAHIEVSRAVAIAVELHAFLATPPSYIRFGELRSETLGRPALWATVTMLAWL